QLHSQSSYKEVDNNFQSNLTGEDAYHR
ncbi:MAG: hypothetical protein DGJ47_000984, partial [Rickettsiaceae bacterium]